MHHVPRPNRIAPLLAHASRALAVALLTTCAAACAATDEPAADDDEGATGTSSSEAAFTGAIPSLTRTKRPASTPASWVQPASTGAFGQNGYCGATAAANLLRWYGREVSPSDTIRDGCWSYVGTRAQTLAAYFTNHQADLGCRYETLDYEANALAHLRATLASGRPVVLEFMTGALNAHWVTVIGVQGSGDDPQIVVMSWGDYYTARWSTLDHAWRNAWGGYYPHVVCNAVSPGAQALHVDK